MSKLIYYKGEKVIHLKDVTKYYKTGSMNTYVLRHINLVVEEGEFVTIMGPSGAGKTTLLNLIGMLDDMSEGEYCFLNLEVHKMNEKKRSMLYKENIGFVFQSYHLIDELTVYENLETPLLYKKVKGSERKSIVCDILDRFQFVGKKDLFPSQLSGGQQQLVGVARAIITKPKLLLADEPTGNLHSSQGEEVMDILTKLNKEGTTIIQVTHSDKNATYGNRIVYLKDGWIVDKL
jgi:putative ABC transport system ATP-binding protein